MIHSKGAIVKEKLSKLIDALSHGLVERREVIQASLLTMLAQENLILIGPPGTAKSEISRRLTQVIKDSSYFEYLLTKFTTPEEVFGPLSIKELKQGKFQRNTEDYLPTADIAFLDEIFKANSAILNSLLTIINEHVFHNGSKKDPSPLISLIGASNELPIGNDELSALYDRFLVRKHVGYVSDDGIDELMQAEQKVFELDDSLKLSRDEIIQINEKAKEVTIPDDIVQILKDIRLDFKKAFKENADESLSDRRFIKLLKLIKVSACTNDRDTANRSDLYNIVDCLWSNPDNNAEVHKIIKEQTTKLLDYQITTLDDIKTYIKSLRSYVGAEINIFSSALMAGGMGAHSNSGGRYTNPLIFEKNIEGGQSITYEDFTFNLEEVDVNLFEEHIKNMIAKENIDKETSFDINLFEHINDITERKKIKKNLHKDAKANIWL